MQVNQEAEQYLLGCILHDGELIKEISLQTEHFFTITHKKIFAAMKECEKDEEPIDIGTISLKIMDVLEDPTYITKLYKAIPSIEPYKRYEKYILDAWKLRQAELIANKLKESQDAAIISDSITALSRLEEIGHEDDFDLQSTLKELHEDFEQDYGDLTGIDTGYRDLNLFTNGWQKGDLIIVGARPSMGKTAFALNMAEKAGIKNAVTTIFSLEMGEKSLLKRMVSSIGGIDATKLKNPKKLFTEDDERRKIKAFGIIGNMNLHIYDNPSVTVQEIRSKVRKLKRKYPDHPHICFVDYLTLIKGNRNENRVQEVGEITRALKIMAREFEMPFIVLAQLSRSVEQRQDKRPMMSDLRDSGEIEQHADIIAFLYRDDYYDQSSEEKNVIEIIVAKQRNGATGTVKLAFLKEYNRFTDLAYGY